MHAGAQCGTLTHTTIMMVFNIHYYFIFVNNFILINNSNKFYKKWERTENIC